MLKIKIKENAFVARLAARKLKSKNVAIVFGNTINLHGVTKQNFLAQDWWLRHEVTHVLQYKRYGFIRFLFLYLIESIKHGYYNNKFEVEARSKENDKTILKDVKFY